MTLSKELLNRLICAKQLYVRGQETLESNSLFYCGMTVLCFQDATEMLLRVIAEGLHCTVKENTAFNQLIDIIDSKGTKKLTHRSALNQLNKSRLNFKHFGLEPRVEDVKKFERDLDGFFPNTVQMFLGVDYDSISLVHLIGHTRTENYLLKVEDGIISNDYESAVLNSAISFEIFSSYLLKNTDSYNNRNSFSFSHFPEINDWSKGVDKALINNQRYFNLIENGINLSLYKKFKSLIPSVSLSEAKTLHINRTHVQNYTRDNALFCKNFVLDYIFKIKENYSEPSNLEQMVKRKFIVKQESEIIVWPIDSPEVLTIVLAEDILLGLDEKYDKPNYASIFFEGDRAYIKSSSVEPYL